MTSAPASHEPVAIVGGSGALGSALALRLSLAGVPVLLGSREEQRAVEALKRIVTLIGPRMDDHPIQLSAATNRNAVDQAELVLLCVPFRSHSETFTNLRPHLRPGQLIVDATVPLAAAVSGKATRTIGVWQGSAAQQAQEMVPEGVRVVSALHTVAAKTLGDLNHALAEDVLLCGDERADKARVAGLLQRIPGLRCVDAGPLEQARIVEQLTAVLIGINIRHRAHAGIQITGLPDAAALWPEHPNPQEDVR
ncbi:MAG: NADPH-dependent F420 reductase [Solirubrobacteraceae bacterium]|nr:NADPH-dependent F420 reductase [Solirubrobacteraceae bacterium]